MSEFNEKELEKIVEELKTQRAIESHIIKERLRNNPILKDMAKAMVGG